MDIDLVVDDLAVAHGEDTICDLGGFGIVSDHENGLVELTAGVAEHVEYGVGVFGVEVTGGLVGEDNGGAVDEGAGDGDALLLSAGEFVGAVIEATGDAEQIGEVVEQGAIESGLGRGAEVGDVVGDLDVAHGGEGGEQVETLEDEADFGATHLGTLGIGQPGEVDSIDEHRAGGGVGETAEDVKECGFTGARGAYDGDELAGHDGEADVAQCGDFEFAGAVGLAEVLGDNDGGDGCACLG